MQDNVIKLDSKRWKRKLKGYQSSCSRSNSVFDATLLCLSSTTELTDGMYITKLEFASVYGLSPLIKFGIETFEKMNWGKFEEIDFTPILNK